MSNKHEIDEMKIVSIITSAGEANGLLQLAFSEAMKGDFHKVEEHLKNANMALNRAHQTQTDLLHEEANGVNAEISLLMVHAQDHLMNVVLSKQLIGNMIEMQKQINDLKEKQND